jgi:predicted PurR-regulated permease PerM
VVLLMAVSGFVALLLNPLVVYLQRWKVHRRGFASPSSRSGPWWSS